MEVRELEVVQARFARAQRWLRVTVVGWILTVVMLVMAWAISMALLSTGVQLFSSVFNLP